MNVEEVLNELKYRSDPEVARAKAEKFGIPEEKGMLGVYQKGVNEVVKNLKKDSSLAFELYETGIYEARMVAAKICRPKDVSFETAELWVKDFTNWEFCDTFCMKLFAYTEWADKAIRKWSLSDEEFIKRAAYATLAARTLAHKNGTNEYFESFFDILKAGATDNRLYVKKAVSWALRSMGKRNPDLLKSSLVCAEDILLGGSDSEVWIAKDVLKELSGSNVRISNYPRGIYGK